MKRGQVLILVIMAIFSIGLLGAAVIMGLSVVNADSLTSIGNIASMTEPEATPTDVAEIPSATPTETGTPTPVPTNTPSPTPTDTAIPTATATLVVHSTATKTPTKTPRPTRTPIVTDTPVPASNSNVHRNWRPAAPQPTPIPTSRYPFRIQEGPLDYPTKNHFLVVLTKVTRGGAAVANYRLVGFHTPSGEEWESAPSCDHFCKGSAPVAASDENGNLVYLARQEGNLAFEFPHYERGAFTLFLVDAQHNQASEPIHLALDSDSDNRKWFYVHFSQ